MEVLRTPLLTEAVVRERISTAVGKQFFARGNQPTSVFVTGGSSCPYWMPGLLEIPDRLRNAGFFLTDSFTRQAALAEGRQDTNEGAVLDAGLAKALGSQTVHPNQVFFPVFNPFSSLEDVAAHYGRQLRKFRGEATADILFLSAGGGEYSKGGRKDPGHVAGLPDLQPELFRDQLEPFLVVRGMPKPPKERISMTPGMISRAGLLVLFILGEAKRGSLDNLLGDLSPENCPAALARNHRNVLVVTDLAA